MDDSQLVFCETSPHTPSARIHPHQPHHPPGRPYSPSLPDPQRRRKSPPSMRCHEWPPVSRERCLNSACGGTGHPSVQVSSVHISPSAPNVVFSLISIQFTLTRHFFLLSPLSLTVVRCSRHTENPPLARHRSAEDRQHQCQRTSCNQTRWSNHQWHRRHAHHHPQVKTCHFNHFDPIIALAISIVIITHVLLSSLEHQSRRQRPWSTVGAQVIPSDSNGEATVSGLDHIIRRRRCDRFIRSSVATYAGAPVLYAFIVYQLM